MTVHDDHIGHDSQPLDRTRPASSGEQAGFQRPVWARPAQRETRLRRRQRPRTGVINEAQGFTSETQSVVSCPTIGTPPRWPPPGNRR